nr:MAG TPA: hypothetical protein [Caudoviricetes sp.]
MKPPARSRPCLSPLPVRRPATLKMAVRMAA